MDDKRRNDIIAKLNEKKVNKSCPRCSHNNFSILEDTFILIQPNMTKVALEGQVVPVVITVCNNCGYIAQHSQGILGVKKQEW